MSLSKSFTTEQKKVLFLSSLGGVLEFYDFIVYIFLTNVIEKLFFTDSSTFAATLKTLAVFSIGYLLRPLGGILFSHFGDRYGRKVVFILTVVFMAVPSFAISLLPTAAQIGIAAPLLLLLFRMMQGLALGGEIPAAITFVAEHVNPKQTGFATATLFFGINMGLLLGSLVTALMTTAMSTQALYAYGWRIPFFVGGVFGILSVILRKYLHETVAFSALHHNEVERIPFVTLIKHYWRNVIQGACLVALGSVSVFFYLYWPHYLTQYMGYTLAPILNINSIGIFILSSLILVYGYIADRIGYRKVYAAGALGIILLALPIFLLFTLHSVALVALSYLIFAIIFSPITGSYPAILSSLFPTPIRYSGIATSYNLAFAIFGGLSPIICTLVIYYFNSPLAPSLYLILVAVMALIACLYPIRQKLCIPTTKSVMNDV